MRNAERLYREGQLAAAIDLLRSYLQDDPGSREARTFLFELLLFAGEFERAGHQLRALPQDSREGGFGTLFYQAALQAETDRQACYHDAAAGSPGEDPPAAAAGRVDGRPFSEIRDADPRLGASLEFLAAGAYHRIPFRRLARVEFEPAARVRDLYWRPAQIQTCSALGDQVLDSILVPALYPDSHLIDDDCTRLGRATEWACDQDGVEAIYGHRLLVIDGLEVPMQSISRLEFDADE